MFVSTEARNSLEQLIKKAIEANSRMLDGLESMPRETRLQVIGSVTYNIDSLNKAVQG